MAITDVKKNIRDIYRRKEAALYALSLEYAAMAIKYFRSLQPPEPNSDGKFWHNVTGQAAARMFTDGFIENNIVGWFMSHGVDYGVDLELANDRAREAIRPVIEKFAKRFFEEAKKIIGQTT